MGWVIDSVLIIGFVAFLGQIFLRFSADDNTTGTNSRFWISILTIVMGVCFFGLLGVYTMIDYFQSQLPLDLISGIASTLLGLLAVFNGATMLLSEKSNLKIKRVFSLPLGIMLILWGSFAQWGAFQENGRYFPDLQYVVLMIVGVYIVAITLWKKSSIQE